MHGIYHELQSRGQEEAADIQPLMVFKYSYNRTSLKLILLTH